MGNTLATIITALAGLGGVVVGSLISWSVQARLLGQRIAADKELAEQKRSDELRLAERKFDYERDLHAQKARRTGRTSLGGLLSVCQPHSRDSEESWRRILRLGARVGP
jgi:hypothetical protein